jgi:Periplasmic binding protein
MTINRRHGVTRLSLVAAGIAVLATACGSSKAAPTTTVAPATTAAATVTTAAAAGAALRVGIITIQEGPFAVLGEDGLRGVNQAIAEVGGTVAGRKIETTIVSSDASPDSAVAAARKLVEQAKVDVVVGPLSGDEGIAVKEYAKSHRTSSASPPTERSGKPVSATMRSRLRATRRSSPSARTTRSRTARSPASPSGSAKPVATSQIVSGHRSARPTSPPSSPRSLRTSTPSTSPLAVATPSTS